MVILKSPREIAQLREAGRIVAETYEVLRPHLVPGVTTAEIDKIAEDFIRSKGAIPSYKGYGALPASKALPPCLPSLPTTFKPSIHATCQGFPAPNNARLMGILL